MFITRSWLWKLGLVMLQWEELVKCKSWVMGLRWSYMNMVGAESCFRCYSIKFLTQSKLINTSKACTHGDWKQWCRWQLEHERIYQNYLMITLCMMGNSLHGQLGHERIYLDDGVFFKRCCRMNNVLFFWIMDKHLGHDVYFSHMRYALCLGFV
jgi:hypothetical protein